MVWTNLRFNQLLVIQLTNGVVDGAVDSRRK